jgi:cysteine desulfuration protein SufE
LKNHVTEFPPTVDELLETFADLPEWDERYDFIIDLGRELPEPTAELHRQDNIVDGCMSTVWLLMKMGHAPGAPLEIRADSDSLIVKGLIVVLMAFYADKTAAEIIASDVSDYLKQLGLDQHLSPQRRNGLFAMIKRINALAEQHQAA